MQIKLNKKNCVLSLKVFSTVPDHNSSAKEPVKLENTKILIWFSEEWGIKKLIKGTLHLFFIPGKDSTQKRTKNYFFFKCWNK